MHENNSIESVRLHSDDLRLVVMRSNTKLVHQLQLDMVMTL